MMKKIVTVYFLAIAMMLFAGCKQNTEKMLVGVWQGTVYTSDNKSLSQQMIEGGQTIHKSTVYGLHADGTFDETVFDKNSNGNWTFDAATKKITFSYKEKAGPQEIQKFTYEVISVNHEELKVKNSLNGEGFEYLTFKKVL